MQYLGPVRTPGGQRDHDRRRRHPQRRGNRPILNALATRAAIEQAKGAIMAVQRCDADEAWALLRRASQEFNIKLRELAVAFVELIGQAPAEQPADAEDKVVAEQPAHRNPHTR